MQSGSCFECESSKHSSSKYARRIRRTPLTYAWVSGLSTWRLAVVNIFCDDGVDVVCEVQEGVFEPSNAPPYPAPFVKSANFRTKDSSVKYAVATFMLSVTSAGFATDATQLNANAGKIRESTQRVAGDHRRPFRQHSHLSTYDLAQV